MTSALKSSRWTLELRTLTGYPMTALTERPPAIMEITYPVVI
jgi:hypothetical protein